MNQVEFEELFQSTIDELFKLLVVKGGEYAGSSDRLGNFKRGADRVGIHPLQILWIYAAKHIDSIETFIRDTAGGTDRPRSEPIAGRFDDLINYCILAKALIKEADDAKQKALSAGSNLESGHRVSAGNARRPLDLPAVRIASDDQI